ncbi:hypothetical protein Avbf_19206 [Armadillidium vulgare]|nr:hypothetical protein Avbf_19206 [Armadillidium vulgare]
MLLIVSPIRANHRRLGQLKPRDKEQACLGSRDHFWSYDQCECLCRKTISCSSGQGVRSQNLQVR